MQNKFVKFLLSFIVPLIVIAAIFNYNRLIGVLAAAGYFIYLLYIRQAGIYALLGNLKYSSGNMDAAITYFDKAYKTGKCKPKTIISYAYLLLKSGKIDEPERILNNILDTKLQTDDMMFAKSNLALVLWKKGDIDKAIAVLEEIFENYKNTTLYGSLGYMFVLKGDLDRALEFNLEAYDYNNTNPVILDNLGQTYYFRGEYDKAEEIYSTLMATNPTIPGAYFNYGLVLNEKGDFEKALEYMRKALNYKITFLSGVTEEEVKAKIEELEKRIG